MSDVIHVRGEGGAVWEMTVPLHPVLQKRYDAGELVRVNRDGSAWSGQERPAQKPRPKRKPAVKAGADDDAG